MLRRHRSQNAHYPNTHAPSNYHRTTLVSTGNAGPGLTERVGAVLGSKVAALMVPIEVDVPQHGVKITG